MTKFIGDTNVYVDDTAFDNPIGKRDWWYQENKRKLAPKAVDILLAFKKYVTIHNDIFGEYDHNLPQQLEPKKKELIKKSYFTFLKDNGLEAMIPFAKMVVSAQG